MIGSVAEEMEPRRDGRWIRGESWEDCEEPSAPFLLLFSRYCDLILFFPLSSFTGVDS